MPSPPIRPFPQTIRRSLVLRITPSSASLHSVITDLVRKRVLIEELHFETGTEHHQVHLVVRGTPDRLEHAARVLDNNIAVITVAAGTSPPAAATT